MRRTRILSITEMKSKLICGIPSLQEQDLLSANRNAFCPVLLCEFIYLRTTEEKWDEEEKKSMKRVSVFCTQFRQN